MRYVGAGVRSPSLAIAAMPCSRPLPGPTNPQLSTSGLVMAALLAGAGLGPGAVRDHDDPLPIGDRVVAEPERAASVWVTVTSASSMTCSSTARWCAVGSASTVWSTAMLGVVVVRTKVEHLVAVGSPVDPVLVLEDDDVDILDGVAHLLERRGVAGDPVDRGSRRITGRSWAG